MTNGLQKWLLSTLCAADDEDENVPTNKIISTMIGEKNMCTVHVNDLQPNVDAARKSGELPSHKTPVRKMVIFCICY